MLGFGVYTLMHNEIYSVKEHKKAFTLVELLVVIAIIALLMSILMPALTKARKQAKAAICLSYVKQWGLITMLYAQDNNSRLMQSVAGNNVNDKMAYWMGATLKYYKDPKIRFCPSTKLDRYNVLNSSFDDRDYGTTYEAWGPVAVSSDSTWWDEFPEGSYGINEWCADPPIDRTTYWGAPTSEAWRTTNVGGAQNIPLFVDSRFLDGYPRDDNPPPEIPDEPVSFWSYLNEDAMKLYCIDRHNRGVNAVFLDASARKIGLKELWTLKWHRTYNVNGEWTKPDAKWPAWLREY